ncbi:MAG: hemolysin family protein [Gemmatimonadales bacterium]
MRGLWTALVLWVAPLLAGLFTLWAGLMAIAAQDDEGVPRLLTPSRGRNRGPLPPARAVHVTQLALLAAGAALAGTAMAWWAWPVPGAAGRLAVGVLLVWIIGDLAPRLWAANEPGIVRFDGWFVQHTLALFRPLLTVVAWADRGGRPVRLPASVPPPDEREMLTGILSLAEMTVAEVMTPRLDIVAVDFSAPEEPVVETFKRSERSRLLVTDGDPDSVTGVLYAKDLLAGVPGGAPRHWHQLIRSVEFVPEGKTLERQLRDFQRGGSHLAVVVDEFGGTSGLVTLEDVLEQIVGEIRDEYDTDEAAPVVRTPDGGWVVQGNAPLADLEAEVGHPFGRENVSTVGGLVLACFGRVPRTGESIEIDGFRLTADQVIRRRVRRVSVTRVRRLSSVEARQESLT